MNSYLSAADGARYVRLIINFHGQIQAFLDYIALARPDLKEQISDLSAILPDIADCSLPS